MKLLGLFTILLLLSYSCNTASDRAQHPLDTNTLQHADNRRLSQTHADGKAARISGLQKTFDTYTVDYPSENLQLYWKDDADNMLISIDRLKEYVEKKGEKLIFATNAGIYLENNSPQGLYIEDGKELRPLDIKKKVSNANFYMQPNGIFLLTKDRGIVMTTDDYKNYKGHVKYATQSGPMLVIDGKINQVFKKGSPNNFYIRSGVGINKDGKIVFAISNLPSNFYDFAMLFKSTLHCDNALYLDGAICRMYLPALSRMQTGGNFGAMIGVSIK